MPASSASSANRPEDLISQLRSDNGAAKLKALRELKNQIIGNRTKKLFYIKHGAVPPVVSILSSSSSSAVDSDAEAPSNSLLVQSAAVIGSFACGFDAGVKAVLEAGAFPHLLSLISHHNQKVVDAGARSLRMIYQSKLTPRYDFLQEKNVKYLLSLLNSENENVTGLGASIIIHSCRTSIEQRALSDAGVLKRLTSLLGGSLCQRDASLEALAIIIKGSPEVVSKFLGPENGKAVGAVADLTKDRYPRTRLLACLCLIALRDTSICYLEDVGTETKVMSILLELLDDPGQVGDEAAFALSSLIAEKENLQKLAVEANVIDKLCSYLKGSSLQASRIQGILLALADICSKLECCRARLLSLQVLNLITDALSDQCANVRAAACICLKSISRSVKNLSAGCFMNEVVVIPLVQLLDDTSTSVQIAALGAISNIVVDFTMHKSIFIQCGGVKQLVQLARSMEPNIRVNAMRALRNLVFLTDSGSKEVIFSELTASTLTSLICDSEPSVQEQALAFVCNLLDGSIENIKHVFVEDGLILHAVGRQLLNASNTEVLIQGMYVFCNIASGSEFHKEAVMHQLFSQLGNNSQPLLLNLLQSNEGRLRTAAAWTVVNLTSPSSPNTNSRVAKLQNCGIHAQLKIMAHHDTCVDAKFRAQAAEAQFKTFGDVSP